MRYKLYKRIPTHSKLWVGVFFNDVLQLSQDATGTGE